ncbi:putative cysteine desulfurase [bioreactor metagenome]|uniref:Putative cysteine desulfurase n=1 Tax=bioreactor metagenome TaxID=1076179 RepID=A0A645GRG5_9ZZZZ
MNVDMLAFSGHKGLLGPQGTGGLYIRPGLEVNPLRYGGTGSLSESDLQPEFLPDRLESGTPNTPGIAGLLAGVRFVLMAGQENIRAKESELAQTLIDGLNNIPGVEVFGPTDTKNRTAVVSCNIIGMDSGEAAHVLDNEFGIASRAGLHCAPWAHRTIGTIETGTIRFSPGFFNTKEEILQTLDAVSAVVRRRR